MERSTSKVDGLIERYLARTPKARSLFERAQQHLTGGVTRTSTYFQPYPIFFESGRGCRVTDVDGNTLIDFWNNYTSLIHGHAHPALLEASLRQMEKGTAFPGPTEQEARLAEILCQRIPSLEQVRFTPSGTEATMFALKVARAFTGRSMIAKMEGGYHGTHNDAMVSLNPPLNAAGDPRRPVALRSCAGVPDNVTDQILVLPFNNLAACEELIHEHRDHLAAVITEPIPGSAGVIPPLAGFLEGLRKITKECGIILIFDEIQTLRVGYHGAQGRFAVTPDLTTMGKMISGGWPAAAFGGRAEVMAVLDQRDGGPKVPQGGTFTGNPVAMAAGASAMELLTPEEFERLEVLGDRLRLGLTALFERREVPAQVTGLASYLNMHFCDHPVTDYRSACQVDKEAAQIAFLGLLEEGILTTPRGQITISTPMTEAEVDAFLAAMERVLSSIYQD